MTFKQPAAKWYEALPLGNGSMGAMSYGRFQNEKIELNLDTLWSGTGKRKENSNREIDWEFLRNNIFDEKYQEALKMAVEMAKNKADAMAEAAGMTVVKAVNISEDGYYPQARYNTAGASAKQMMAVTEDATADIGVMPGEIFIEAQVSVTFEME